MDHCFLCSEASLVLVSVLWPCQRSHLLFKFSSQSKRCNRIPCAPFQSHTHFHWNLLNVPRIEEHKWLAANCGGPILKPGAVYVNNNPQTTSCCVSCIRRRNSQLSVEVFETLSRLLPSRLHPSILRQSWESQPSFLPSFLQSLKGLDEAGSH